MESSKHGVGLAKYHGRDRYLTDWEKNMKTSINSIIDDEIKVLIDKGAEVENPRFIYWQNNPIAWKLYRDEKEVEYEEKYRKNYTLGLLRKCGLDIVTFKETEMYKFCRSLLLLECIQDKIDGFDYDLIGNRVSNDYAMDLSNTRCTYECGVLTLTDSKAKYEFRIDEHQIIYVNNENILKLEPIPTEEEKDVRLNGIQKKL